MIFYFSCILFLIQCKNCAVPKMSDFRWEGRFEGTWTFFTFFFFLSCATYRVCRLLIRPSISRCPAEYCSMTSFTSYGRNVSLNFLLATRNFKILQKTHTHTRDSLLTLHLEPLKSLAQHIRTFRRTVNLWENAGQLSNGAGDPENNKINHSHGDLIIHKQPHKGSGVASHQAMWIYCDDDNISKRHLLISTCCFSKSADSNVWHTHTHTHTPLSFPLFLLFSQFDSHVVATGEQQLLRVPSAHSSSSPPTCGGITRRNVDPAVLRPASTSLTTSSEGVRRHEGWGGGGGGSGGCARDNGKGAEEGS